MNEPPRFSVITFFAAFQRNVKKINKYPLSEDNLVIHQDLVKMLGDDEVRFDYPFASVAMDRPRSFDDLLFSVELYDDSFTVSVDQQVAYEMYYETLRFDEEQLARDLVDIITGLANGQIFVLASVVEPDATQAAEIVYKQKGANLYSVLRTFAFFDKHSKQADAEYSTHVRRNDFDIPAVRINTKLLEQVIPYSLETNRSNRKPFADLSEPLTREKYSKNVDDGSEIWSQNYTANWFPGYGNKNNTKLDTFVSYAYYRYVEVIVAIGGALALLTLSARTVQVNILLFAGLLLFTVLASIYLRKVGRAMWVFGVLAYAAALAYVAFFPALQPHGFWGWVVAILALEPIVEMLIADFYALLKKKK